MSECFSVEIDEITADMEIDPAVFPLQFCPVCGKEIARDRYRTRMGRPRKFCSDSCRKKYWKEHHNSACSGSAAPHQGGSVEHCHIQKMNK